MSLVQYSDEAKTEFKLNFYKDKGVAMAAPQHIRYRGGNTKTGKASYPLLHWLRSSSSTSCSLFTSPFLTHFLFVFLHSLFLTHIPPVTGVALKHTYEKAFSVENGMRRNVPKVVVAITDGRSQDEVKKNAAKLQHAGSSNSRLKKL